MEAIRDLILGVVGNGLTAVLAPILRKPVETIAEELGPIVVPKSVAETIMEDGIEAASSVMTFGDEHVVSFLKSPQVDVMVRQVFATSLMSDSRKGTIPSIREQFVLSFALHVGRTESAIREQAEFVFDKLIGICNAALVQATNANVLGAKEARDEYRFGLLRDLMEAIVKRQDYLISALAQKPALSEIQKFESDFRVGMSAETGFITPPHLDKQQVIPIDDLYVYPEFTGASIRRRNGESERLTVSELLSVTYRCVIVGDPGAGKSTFSRKLCFDLSEGKTLVGGRQYTPILVVLRDYAEHKRNKGSSILQYIEWMANAHLQTPPPNGAFEYLLTNGHVLLVFDGLDELLRVDDRRRIARDVEAFGRRYPAVPVVVTSRIVGYDQAPLKPSEFEVYGLAPFSYSQVADYAQKWFSVGARLPQEEGHKRAYAFLRESRVAPDIRCNPLMLGLMCNLYWRERYIPQNRPQLYKKCATLLFQQWDSGRGIPVPASFEVHLESTIQYLAFWIYSNPKHQSGVTDQVLIETAADYLFAERFEDRDEARAEARKLIEYSCTGRAWVFSDTGSKSDGDPLYAFTHQTFLEYFAAKFLLRQYYTPELLWRFLSPRIAAKEWDVVAQLAFHIQCTEGAISAKDVLFDSLLGEAARHEGSVRWNYLSFAARCLQFMTPKPQTTRQITRTCLVECFSWGQNRMTMDRKNVTKLRYQPKDLLLPILTATLENRPFVTDTLEHFLTEMLHSDAPHDGVLALEVLHRLTYALPNVDSEWTDDQLVELRALWGSVTERVLNSGLRRISLLAHSEFFPCLVTIVRGLASPDIMVKHHGVPALFTEYKYILWPGSRTFSLVGTVLVNLLRGQSTISPFPTVGVLASLGQTFLDNKDLRFSIQSSLAKLSPLSNYSSKKRSQASDIDLSEGPSTARLGAILLFNNLTWDQTYYAHLVDPLGERLRSAALSRNVSELGRVLPECHLSSDQEQVVYGLVRAKWLQ